MERIKQANINALNTSNRYRESNGIKSIIQKRKAYDANSTKIVNSSNPV